jgi:hypothetical protein
MSIGIVTCDLGSLVSGGNATVTIVVRVDDAQLGTITNRVSVTGDGTDPNTSNNSATQETSIQTWIFLPLIVRNP